MNNIVFLNDDSENENENENERLAKFLESNVPKQTLNSSKISGNSSIDLTQSPSSPPPSSPPPSSPPPYPKQTAIKGNRKYRNDRGSLNNRKNGQIINNTIIFVNNSNKKFKINNLNIDNSNINIINKDERNKKQKVDNSKKDEEPNERRENENPINSSSEGGKKTHFQCNICKDGMMLDSITAAMCGHCFCLACIEGHLKKSNTCPTCKKRIHKSQIHPMYLNLEKF
ncbi:hypothetical protein DICPUDRAFT_84227 [Dictyostelium purpureum]|uniref:RING-type domain-containing protein n=1 Tax=Dictyostelium purpureum TaxID=5786 RepID=F1A1Z4_DICPU|nr:uncharacterized protein DICPUDRAFT_84227 [Dictyostelium purpureum]EGC29780.1 hypothetical protein DICPUDRAFT_84227 [Dictyostelium purpureum]|eukprot:XP_003293688.1 hypothetical protein DICPUDRAFT_84227 [Dictyostelium purpureum]